MSAPTGSAAHNANGQTHHREFLTDRNPTSEKISDEKAKLLKNQLKNIVVLIFDECSLLDAKTLGNVKNNVRQCAYQGRRSKEPWGGVPIILVFGDHFQLPSIKTFLCGELTKLQGWKGCL